MSEWKLEIRMYVCNIYIYSMYYAYIVYYIYIYVHKPLGVINHVLHLISQHLFLETKKNTWKAPSLLKNHSSLSGTHPLGLSYLLMSGLAKAQHVGAKVKFDVRGLSNNLVTKPHRVDVSSSGFGWFESMGLFFRWSWNTGKTPETLHNKRYMLR